MQLIQTTKTQNGDILVSARELHQFLDGKERFSKWFERMTSYGLIEGIDYTPYQNVHPQNNQPLIDYTLKIDAAKEICMLQRNDKGKEARQYFIETEKAYKQQQLPQDNMILALEAALSAQKQIQQVTHSVQTIGMDVQLLKNTMRIDTTEQYQIRTAGQKRVLTVLGGKESVAYKHVSKSCYHSLWGAFKKHFQLPSYQALPKAKFGEAMEFISLWQPETTLLIEIKRHNETVTN